MTILYTILSLCLLGAVSALVLFFVAQRFKVYEDPRIDLVEAALPAANCGGCGYAGCRNLAETMVKASSLDGLFCPVGGNKVMTEIAALLGREATVRDARVAVLKCNGTCENRPTINHYDGMNSCALVSYLYIGESGCTFGCVGCGDCVAACTFDALRMDLLTGLPVVDDLKCTACGVCLKACPRDLFELRKRWKGDKKIYVACMNRDIGVLADKYCRVACTGCGKCFEVCTFEAIAISDSLAYIDSDLCRLCRKCTTVCPTNSILEIGFPIKKIKSDDVVVSAQLNQKEEKSA
jgi:Na+-translocating ferredoxin:NAD+ oxidoreductase subunit B